MNAVIPEAPTPACESQSDEIEQLGPWFHNLHLPDGRQTCPDHWLGDFPSFKWRQLSHHLPADLTGWSCLDIGCNAGFYTFELARRGASVLGIDLDEEYLAAHPYTGLKLWSGLRNVDGGVANV